jgi:DNA-binding Lrp family transcriptional regulator
LAIAFVCITTEPDYPVEVLQKVRTIEGVEEATMVYGIYDIVAKVKGDTIGKIKEITTKHIRKTENVQRTLTMIGFKSE